MFSLKRKKNGTCQNLRWCIFSWKFQFIPHYYTSSPFLSLQDGKFLSLCLSNKWMQHMFLKQSLWNIPTQPAIELSALCSFFLETCQGQGKTGIVSSLVQRFTDKYNLKDLDFCSSMWTFCLRLCFNVSSPYSLFLGNKKKSPTVTSPTTIFFFF